MLAVPTWISGAFVATTLLTFWLFWRSSRKTLGFVWASFTWLALHGILAFLGFYQNLQTQPPRIILTLVPSLLFILFLFTSTRGRSWIDSMDVQWLTLLHMVRVPVELILYGLYLEQAIPGLMTFAGRNWDILAGITAPFVFYFRYIRGSLGKRYLLYWNVLGLALLLNIVIIALLSAPLPFQQFAFEQPNKAVLFFPFVWLPAYVVPLVLLSHLIMIRRVLKPRKHVTGS